MSAERSGRIAELLRLLSNSDLMLLLRDDVETRLIAIRELGEIGDAETLQFLQEHMRRITGEFLADLDRFGFGRPHGEHFRVFEREHYALEGRNPEAEAQTACQMTKRFTTPLKKG